MDHGSASKFSATRLGLPAIGLQTFFGMLALLLIFFESNLRGWLWPEAVWQAVELSLLAGGEAAAGTVFAAFPWLPGLGWLLLLIGLGPVIRQVGWFSLRWYWLGLGVFILHPEILPSLLFQPLQTLFYLIPATLFLGATLGICLLWKEHRWIGLLGGVPGYSIALVWLCVFPREGLWLDLVLPASSAEVAFAAPRLLVVQFSLWFWPVERDSVWRVADPRHLAPLNLLFWLILALLVRQGFRVRRRMPGVFYGLLWFLATGLLLCGILGFYPLPQPLASACLLIPGLGLTAVTLSLAQAAIGWLAKKWSGPLVATGATLVVLLGLWLALALNATLWRVPRWENLDTRVQATLRNHGNLLPARIEEARALTGAGDFTGAEQVLLSVEEQAEWYSEEAFVRARLLMEWSKRDQQTLYLTGAIRLLKPFEGARVEAAKLELEATREILEP